jgi:hypothetical protein
VAPAPSRGEGMYYLVLGAITLLLASVPYLYGWLNTPQGRIYSGLTYNIDDTTVYLTWMRQAETGHFFQRNLFSTEEQKGILFNLLFLLLGNIARFTHLSLIAVYHGARIVFGGLALWATVALLKETLNDVRARRLAYALACLAGGLGWLWASLMSTGFDAQPIDNWQPEAVNFLSLYFTPLFAAALFCITWFWASVFRAERTGKWRDLWPACLMALLLGNFHTYDVLPIFASWGLYRIITDGIAKKIDRAGWLRLIVAGLCAVPTTGYTAYVLKVDPVFYQRGLVSNTLTAPIWWVLLGFGIPFILSVFAIVKPRLVPTFTSQTWRLLVVWAIVNIAIAYVPVAFQRKMLMGAQIPLYVLAGGVLATLTSRLSGDFPKIAAFFGVLLTVPTNLLWIQRDIGRLSENIGSTPHQPYFTQDEWNALNWLHDHAKPEDAVLVSPDPTSPKRFPFFPRLDPYLSVYVPSFGGATVYNGHWSETAHYGSKLRDMTLFFQADTPDEARQALLSQSGIRYVLYANALAQGTPTLTNGSPVLVAPNTPYIPAAWAGEGTVPPYLTPVYQNGSITIFAVN